jgi:hypothetical protein
MSQYYVLHRVGPARNRLQEVADQCFIQIFSSLSVMLHVSPTSSIPLISLDAQNTRRPTCRALQALRNRVAPPESEV